MRLPCGIRHLQVELVDDLLDIRRIAPRGVELIQERFELRELLNTAQASLLPACANAGQSFRLQAHGGRTRRAATALVKVPSSFSSFRLAEPASPCVG
jgi:hypothetical protein